jgi:hypothetical protein
VQHPGLRTLATGAVRDGSTVQAERADHGPRPNVMVTARRLPAPNHRACQMIGATCRGQAASGRIQRILGGLAVGPSSAAPVGDAKHTRANPAGISAHDNRGLKEPHPVFLAAQCERASSWEELRYSWQPLMKNSPVARSSRIRAGEAFGGVTQAL